MKIILLKDVKGKGKKDQIVDVAQGYANHLIVSGDAVAYNDENTKKLEERKKDEAIKKEQEKEANIALKAEIETKKIVCQLKIGKNGKSFGQVTKTQVVAEFEKQTGIKLNKQKLEMNDIHGIGTTEVKYKLDANIIATFEVKTVEGN